MNISGLSDFLQLKAFKQGPMSNPPKSSVFLIWGGLLLLFAIPAHADLVVAEYAVNGQLTITGNNVCTPSPCTETLQFFFNVDYTLLAPASNGYPPTYFGSVVAPVFTSSSGPLGFFGGGPFSNWTNYYPFSNNLGDEIDLSVDLGSMIPQTFGVPGPPVFLGSDLFACVTPVCVNDFSPYPGAPTVGLYLEGTLQYTATLVPEPSTATLTFFGLAGIGLLAAAHRKLLVLSTSA
jgi:hypothetical protein